MNRLISICAAMILLAGNVFAQNTQTVRGTVTDKDTGEPLEFATVTIDGFNPPLGVTADSLGRFSIKVPIGRHDIRTSYLGYEPSVLKEIQVGSSKEIVLNIGLIPSLTNLNEVVVTPHINKAEPMNSMAVTGGRMLSTEEASRYAGAGDDPARLVSAFAGVTSAAGNNAIVIRGNGPRSLQWRLENVEIPNPNHFAEVTSFGAGGITSLSSFLLGNSDFYTGAFPADYSNALSGVFDMTLRNGNNEQYEHAVQVGSIGVDVASEGPFKKGYNGSYIFNYRYSTLSLISPLLPDDAGGTSYQDLSFKFNFPTRRAGTFSLWGTGLIDRSGTDPEKDPAKWVYDQDMENQDCKQYMAAAGLNHRIGLGGGVLRSTLAFTVNSLDIHTERYDDEAVMQPKDKIKNTYWNFVLSSAYQKRYGTKHTSKTGIRLTGMNYNLNVNNAPILGHPMQNFSEEEGFSALLTAYSTSVFRISPEWTLNAGLNAQVFTLNGNFTIEPRIGAKYKFHSNQSLSLGVGMHSRLEMLNYYFTKKDGEFINKNLDFTKALHVTLAYDINIGENRHLKIEPYFQYLFDAPIIPDSTYCFLNLQGGDDWFLSDKLVNQGKGMNYGIDVTFEKYMSGGLYYMLTGSLFQSQYKTDTGKWYSTRYNRNYAVTVLGGKEWMVGKSRRNVFSLNARLSLQGGERYSPVDEEASLEHNTVVYDENRPFTKQLSPACISSLTVSYKINRKKISHEFAFKAMNLNMYKDYYGHRINHQTGHVEAEREATFMPNLYYRIEF